MNPRAWKALREYRVKTGYLASTDMQENNGGFVVRHPIEKHLDMQIIASDQGGWDHVSALIRNRQNRATRMPFWVEMCIIKDLFWLPTECAIQYHPPSQNYINDNNNVLHIWKPQLVEIPMPPMVFV